MLVTRPIRPTTRQSRRRERHPVNLHGFAARQDGSTAVVKLTDLSYEGCGVETTTELQPGEHIALSVLRRGGLSAVVRWCVQGRAGLAFETAPAPQKRRLSRCSERSAATAEAALCRPGKPDCRARVLDLSPQGCRLEIAFHADVDDHVWIKFDGLEALEATVCWVAGFKMGLRYANPIHPAVFDLLLARFRGEAG